MMKYEETWSSTFLFIKSFYCSWFSFLFLFFFFVLCFLAFLCKINHHAHKDQRVPLINATMFTRINISSHQPSVARSEKQLLVGSIRCIQWCIQQLPSGHCHQSGPVNQHGDFLLTHHPVVYCFFFFFFFFAKRGLSKFSLNWKDFSSLMAKFM